MVELYGHFEAVVSDAVCFELLLKGVSNIFSRLCHNSKRAIPIIASVSLSCITNRDANF